MTSPTLPPRSAPGALAGRHLRGLLVLTLGVALAACPSTPIVPLVGEDPEVYALIGALPPDDPTASPLAAARRLHQSLMQDDAEMVWTLLARSTRLALDERGAYIGASGRELLDASTLPGPGGTVQKVRYEAIFFGRNVVDLQDTKRSVSTDDGEVRTILAVAEHGDVQELRFVREEDGWKLLRTTF